MPPTSIKITFQAALGNLQATLSQANQGFNSLNTRLAATAVAMTRVNYTAKAMQAGLAGIAIGAQAAGYGMNKGIAGGTMAIRRGLLPAISAAGRGMSGLNARVQNVTQRFTGHNSVVNMSASAYKGLVGQVANLNRFFNATFSAIRQVGQGLQNFGTIFSIFVSMPLGLIIAGLTKELLNFDDQMVEVRKTTGLTTAEVKDLGDALTDLSTNTPTAREDLAKMAADWGRMGIEAPDDILKLVRITDQLAIATNLTADQVVTDIGRIGNIYYETTQELAENLPALGSMINELGQANPFTESELLSSATRFAPQAKALDLSIQEMMGLAATAIGTNVSAERAGTQLATSFREMATNLEDFASALGMTEDEVKGLIDADPVGFFLGVVDGLDDITSATEKTIVAQELFGAVGGKSALSFAANTQLGATNIAIANRAFEEAISLQVEFDRAMDSTKNQLGLLKNNAIAAGAAIGEVLLPVITQFVALAVPALQMATVAFGELTDETKLWIVGIGLALTALGPLVIILGTFMFSIGIIGTGLSTMTATLISALFNIGKFAGVLLGILSPFKLVAITVAAIAGAAIFLRRTLDDTSSAMMDFIGQAYDWGSNLITSFSQGISDAAGLVYSTVMSVVNSFVGLLQSFSPPKEGPLKDIEKWGKNLMTSYGDGIVAGSASVADSVRTAAFAIMDGVKSSIVGLSDESTSLFGSMFGQIKSIINAVGSYLDDEIKDATMADWLQRAATELANFLTAAESGGGSLSGLSDILGSLTGDFESLVRLQHEYADATERLEGIKDTLEGLDDATEDQLKAVMQRTDLTLDQRIAMMRKIRQDAIERRKQLEDDKDAAKDEKDAAKDRLTAQKSLVQVLASLIQSKTGTGSSSDSDDDSIAGSITGFDPNKIEADADRIKKIFEDSKESLGSFMIKLSSAREIVSGFFSALSGDEWEADALLVLGENFTKGFEKGKEIRDAIIDFLDQVEAYMAPMAAVGVALGEGLQTLRDGITGGFLDEIDEEKINKLNNLGNAIFGLGFAIGFAARFVDDFITKISDFFIALNKSTGKTAAQLVIEEIQSVWDAFTSTFDPDGSLTGKLNTIVEPLAAIAGLLGKIALLTFSNLEPAAKIIGLLAGFTSDQIANVLNFAGAVATLYLAIFDLGNTDDAIAMLTEIHPRLAELQPLLDGLVEFGKEGFLPFIQSLVDLSTAVLINFATIIVAFTGLKNFIENTIGIDLVSVWITIFLTLTNVMATFVLGLVQHVTLIVKAMSLMFTAIRGVVSKEARESVRQQAKDMGEFMNGMDTGAGVAYDATSTVAGVLSSLDMPSFAADESEETPESDEPKWWNPMDWFNREGKDKSAEAGEAMSETLGESFNTYMGNPQVTSNLTGGVSSALNTMGVGLTADLETVGAQMGADTIDAFTAKWEGDEGTAAAMAILTNLEEFEVNKKVDIEAAGETMGKDVAVGIVEGVGGDNLDDILTAMLGWANDNSTNLKYIGFEIGTTLVKAIGDAIVANSDYIWGKIEEAISSIESVIDVAKNPFKSVEPEPYTASFDPGAVVASSALDVSGISDSTQANDVKQAGDVHLHITVESGKIGDQRDANNLATAIKRQIDRDTRYYKLATA